MNGLIMAGQLLLGLSILVILHELGHFLAARAFGIKVEKFYLFFDAWGFKLFKFKKGDCEYGIGWLPLGGYVKIAGMIDESMDTDQMEQPIQPWEFRAKPAWQRLIVMLGGIIVNVIVGIFIFWMLTFSYGEEFILNKSVVNGVEPGVVGQKIGIQLGDKIEKINGKPVVYFDDIISSKVLLNSPTLTILRDGKEVEVVVPDNILNDLSDYGIKSFIAPRIPMVIEEVQKGNFAEKAGLLPGDKILQLNGENIEKMAFMNAIQDLKDKSIQLTLLRGADTVKKSVQVSAEGNIGIQFQSGSLKTEHIQYGFFEALPVGLHKAWSVVSDNVKGFAKIFSGKLKANKAIQSPIGIAKMYGSTFDWFRFWSLTGLVSMALAFMNLLPIPALDGGHVVFLLLEMVMGRPLSDKFMERAQMVGFVLLLALMFFAFGSDILKMIQK